jgi:arylsulfatase A-like enzyme
LGERAWLRFAVATAALLAGWAAGCGRAPEPGPAAVLVTFDTTRADGLSCLGGRPGNTPNLDALAARSALFTNAHSDSNVTNPSHVSILTGLHAIDHGVMNHFTKLPESVETLVDVLHAKGYATGGFVSARHLGPDLGWRDFDALPDLGNQRTARETTDLALDWLGGVGSRKFFLWVHYWEPHMQYEPPPELAARYYTGDRTAGDGPRIADEPYFHLLPRDGVLRWLGDTRDPAWAPAMYAAEIHVADAEVGRLLRDVEARAGGRTLIVATADHGESLGEHGIYYAHTGLYEPELHVPLIVHWPGAVPLRSDAMVSTLDIAPTVAAFTGVTLDDHRVAGRSLARLVRGEPDPAAEAPRVFVYQNGHNLAVAVRDGDWKLIWPLGKEHPLLSGPPELYDLRSDPGETRDLASSEPGRVASLRTAAERWIALGSLRNKERGMVERLDPAARERLRALGYLQD